MKKFCAFFAAAFALVCAACDLQPKIMSLPDSVGDFISARYPALLADPDTQPEIYNSAASDYGVYASPELYGHGPVDDYVLYASVDDYIVPPQLSSDVPAADISQQSQRPDVEITYHAPDADTGAPIVAADTSDVLVVPMYGGASQETEITVARGDTLYSISRKYNMSVEEVAALNNLAAPYKLSVGQKLRVRAASGATTATSEKTGAVSTTEKSTTVATGAASEKTGQVTTTRVELQEITVVPGDTLYSLSRKYSIPVNDLAVMNNLTAPFNLYGGQKLKVPNLSGAPVRTAATASVAAQPTQIASAKSAQAGQTTGAQSTTAKTATATNTKSATATQAATAKPKEKISSDPKKKLPAISARSSSKFSWPVRGTILSGYGAKSNGLFNDGINIGASRGTAVKAAENGVVAYAGNEVKGMGNLIIVQHSDGWMTVYAHMDSMSVRRGARVSVGQKIGTVGATGKVDRPQLHFEIRKGTKAYNPSSYLKK